MDNRHPFGVLDARLCARVEFNLSRSLRAGVSSIVSNGGWKWPRARSGVTREIVALTPLGFLPNPSQSDK